MAKYRKLGRKTSHRNLMHRNLTPEVQKQARIPTPEHRAKDTNRLVDKMITLGKRGDLHARRQALAYMLDETTVKKLFDEIAPRYAERNGGYTRVLKTMPRKGDNSPMAIIELV